MKHVTFQEYEAAKAEILLGVQYKEDSTLEGNVIRKTYATKENGVFYEAGFTTKTSGPRRKLLPRNRSPDMVNCCKKRSGGKQRTLTP